MRKENFNYKGKDFVLADSCDQGVYHVAVLENGKKLFEHACTSRIVGEMWQSKPGIAQNIEAIMFGGVREHLNPPYPQGV